AGRSAPTRIGPRGREAAPTIRSMAFPAPGETHRRLTVRPGYVKYGSGSIGIPVHQRSSGGNAMTWKCRCGKRGSAFPVAPTYAIASPRARRLPGAIEG